LRKIVSVPIWSYKFSPLIDDAFLGLQVKYRVFVF